MAKSKHSKWIKRIRRMKWSKLKLSLILLFFLMVLLGVYLFVPHLYAKFLPQFYSDTLHASSCAQHIPADSLSSQPIIAFHSSQADGVITPIIAIFAILATLIAFWAQVDANLQHRERMEMDKVERVVFEFIHMHNSILNDTSISREITGKEAFHFMFYEFRSLFVMLNLFTKTKKIKLSNIDTIKIAYNCFYYGVDKLENKTNREEIHAIYNGKYDSLMKAFIKKIQETQRCHSCLHGISQKCAHPCSLDCRKDKVLKQTVFLHEYIAVDRKFNLYDGHLLRLDAYFRLVRNVLDYIHQSKISEEDKTFLYELFRSQFTSHELLLICLNGIYDPSGEWIKHRYLHKNSDFDFLKYMPDLLASKIIEDSETHRTILGY